MALKKEEKKKIIMSLHEVAQGASSIVFADFTGLSSQQMTQLRQQASQTDVKIFVLHNRLTKLAFANTPYQFLIDQLRGPCLCAFSLSHPRVGARVLKDHMKKGPQCSVKGAGFEQQWLSTPDQLAWLENLPTREEGLARLLSLFKELSGGKFLRLLKTYQHDQTTAVN